MKKNILNYVTVVLVILVIISIVEWNDYKKNRIKSDNTHENWIWDYQLSNIEWLNSEEYAIAYLGDKSIYIDNAKHYVKSNFENEKMKEDVVITGREPHEESDYYLIIPRHPNAETIVYEFKTTDIMTYNLGDEIDRIMYEKYFIIVSNSETLKPSVALKPVIEDLFAECTIYKTVSGTISTEKYIKDITDYSLSTKK